MGRWSVVIQLLGAVAALVSGFVWGRAAMVRVPPFTGDSWDGKGPFAEAMKRQTDLNSYAAVAASISAALQAWAVFFQVKGW